eukprot:748158-Rhodomonas_salina.1
MRVQDTVFQHDMEYPFLDLTSIITPGTLTADHINEMHKTDLESGELMDETEAAQDELVGLLTEILASLKEPSQDTTTGTVGITNHQLLVWKRVRDLEAVTGRLLGTDLDDMKPSEQLAQATTKHYKAWTHGSQIPMTAEIKELKDNQLGCCLEHHRFVMKLPADWFPKSVGTQAAEAIMARHCYWSKGKYYLYCEIVNT